MFPLSLEGQVRGSSETKIGEIIDRIVTDLRAQEITCTVESDHIFFAKVVPGPHSLSRYAIVGKGHFFVQAGSITYDLSTRPLVVVAAAFALVAALLSISQFSQSWLQWLSIPVVVWVFFVVPNYILISWRNRAFLRSTFQGSR